MYKRILALMSLIIVLGLAGNASAELVGHWDFNEGSGAVATDSSGNNNDGALFGSPLWVPGRSGTALKFDGDDWVDMGDILTVIDAISIACWVNPAGLVSEQGWVTRQGAYSFKSSGTSARFTTPGIEDYTSTNTVLQDGEWQHVTVTFVAKQAEGCVFYLNGVETDHLNHRGRQKTTRMLAGGGPFLIGNNQWGQFYQGMIDDVRVYDHILAKVDVLAAMEGGKGYPYALEPDPKDGAYHADTRVNLSWRPGGFAVSHDVYLGSNFHDVIDGAESAFRGNQGSTVLIAGSAGFPFPAGLVPGTTYYWRIDEVNDADPNSPWIGDVWSFSVPPMTAYEPTPANGAKFVDAEPTLGWTKGFGARLSTVYFGDDYDAVAEAAGGARRRITDFTPPGPLEPEKTYYWRVDEFDAQGLRKGDVWSFEVGKEGGGVKGEYFQGMNLEDLVLTRADPQIDFSWGRSEPGPRVGADNFSARWTGEVEAAFTEPYTFYIRSDDGVRLWIDGKQLVNAWVNQFPTEYATTIHLVAGNTYSLVMEYYESGGRATARLHWSSPSTPKQPVPQAALSLLVHANNPSPSRGTVGVKLVSTLNWAPGEYATAHDVYLGTDADAVASATKASPEYKGSKALGDESLNPGKLAWDTCYFWRVDEVNAANADSPWIGNIWSFYTGDFLIVEDFEDYNDSPPNEVWNSWIDGFGDGSGTTTNGAIAGYADPDFAGGEHYVETAVVHGGAQSLPYQYDNNLKTSEATKTLVYPRDWTADGVTKLSLWFRGEAGNAPERMFVALDNAVVYHDDPAATQIAGWTEWIIELQEFVGASLSNVSTITLGVGTKNSPAAGGTGMMYFDDIRLYR